MQHFIKKISVFIILLIPGYLFCLILFTAGPLNNWIPNVRNFTGGYGHSLVRFREAADYQEYDLVFIGSSRVYRGFDPRVFERYGLSIFNLGSPAQTSFNTYYLAKKYIDRIHASLFVMEVSSLADNSPDESSIDLISNLPFSREMFEMGMKTIRGKQIRTVNSILAAYLRRIFTPLNKARQRYDPENKYISRGYVETCRMRNVRDRLNMIGPRQKNIEMSSFREILELFREHKKPLLLILVPLSKKLKENTSNYKEFVEAVRKETRRYGYSFIDFNEKWSFKKMELDDLVDFYDGSHLNQKGVEKFNRFMIESHFVKKASQ